MPDFNDRRPSTPAEQRVTKGYAARWHGGGGYSTPDIDDLEHFSTIGAARDEFRNRRTSGRYNNFQKLTVDHTGAVGLGEAHRRDTPGVDENSYMDLHPIRKEGTYDPDVYQRMEFGKRGGVRRSGP